MARAGVGGSGRGESGFAICEIDEINILYSSLLFPSFFFLTRRGGMNESGFSKGLLR